jgi:hypothetical protein
MIPVHESPFVSGSVVLPDREGVEQLIVLFKASYDVSPEGTLTAAPEQDPIVPVDTFRGEPGKSSIVAEAEMMPPKPSGTDVLLVGHAVATKHNTRQMSVRLRVGAVSKTAMVFGTRAWREGALGAAVCTEPQPFETVALIYENAFGGEDQSANDQSKWEGEARNPVGRGFRARSSRAEWRETLLPCIEDPSALIRGPADRPAPMGFGPLGRHWLPRAQYAGTYDARWQQERAPLLPSDFDQRFHHAAPPDQIVAGYVQGGEPVEVVGCTPQGTLGFALPVLRPVATIRLYLRHERLGLRCDSVTVDSDRMKLLMLFKGAIALGSDLVTVEQIGIDLGETGA